MYDKMKESSPKRSTRRGTIYKNYFIYYLLSIILTRLPIVGKYFAIVNTLIHEVGHQLASIITFGEAHKIKLFANTEGVAYSSHRFWIGKVLTALAGYVFSSFMAAIFFVFIYKGKFDLVIYILVAILVISLIFWVRNWYGFFWTLTFSAGLYLAALESRRTND